MLVQQMHPFFTGCLWFLAESTGAGVSVTRCTFDHGILIDTVLEEGDVPMIFEIGAHVATLPVRQRAVLLFTPPSVWN